MKKIDFHCHTTNRKLTDVGASDCTLEAISNNMREFDIESTVVLATYFPQKGTGISNFRLYDWIRDRPEFMMFGSLDYQHYFQQGANELEELAQRGIIRGIKMYTGYQNIPFDSQDDEHKRKREALFRIARTYHLPMMFHGGETHGSMKKNGKIAYEQEVHAQTLECIAKDNDISVVICHLGYPFIDETIKVLSRTPNMYTDMSGLINSANPDDLPYAIDHVRRVLEYVGPSQVLFGTDFPVQTHEHSVHIVQEAMKHFSELDKQAVYYENARRILYEPRFTS